MSSALTVDRMRLFEWWGMCSPSCLAGGSTTHSQSPAPTDRALADDIFHVGCSRSNGESIRDPLSPGRKCEKSRPTFLLIATWPAIRDQEDHWPAGDKRAIR